jgi:hypothetical protein
MSGPASGELERSLAYVRNPGSYALFENGSFLTDGRLVVDCIDPRPRDGVMLTAIQGPGGGVGEGHDYALAVNSMGEKTITLQEGIQRAGHDYQDVMLGGHPDCAYCTNLGAVNQEMAEPGPATQESFDRWARAYGLQQRLPYTLEPIKSAARRLGETGIPEETELLNVVDRLHEDLDNVTPPVGKNNGQVYIVNHLHDRGYDRDRVHRQDGLVQAYHDSLGGGIALPHRMPLEVRRGVVVARLLRSAATRTVINAAHPGLVNLEVHPRTGGGMNIEEVQLET